MGRINESTRHCVRNNVAMVNMINVTEEKVTTQNYRIFAKLIKKKIIDQ